MEIKKCARCGSLYTTENQVCNECLVKDNAEVVKLRGVINEGLAIGTTRQDLAIKAGITGKNLDRYLNTDEFSGIFFPEASKNGNELNDINNDVIKNDINV